MLALHNSKPDSISCTMYTSLNSTQSSPRIQRLKKPQYTIRQLQKQTKIYVYALDMFVKKYLWHYKKFKFNKIGLYWNCSHWWVIFNFHICNQLINWVLINVVGSMPLTIHVKMAKKNIFFISRAIVVCYRCNKNFSNYSVRFL